MYLIDIDKISLFTIKFVKFSSRGSAPHPARGYSPWTPFKNTPRSTLTGRPRRWIEPDLDISLYARLQ